MSFHTQLLLSLVPPSMLPHITNPSLERHVCCWRFLVCWLTIGFRMSRFSTSKMAILWNSIVVFFSSVVAMKSSERSMWQANPRDWWHPVGLHGTLYEGEWRRRKRARLLEKEKRKCLKHESRSRVWERLAFVCSFPFLFKERELHVCWLRSKGHGERDWGWAEREQTNGPGKGWTEKRC